MFGGGGWGRRRFHFLEERGGFWSPHCWSVLCSPMILGQNSASPTDFKNKGQKGVIGEERPKGWPVSMYKAMDGDRPKPLDGPRGAANFLSLFPPEVSSINLCEGRNIFTCPWMAFMSGVEGGSCLTAPSNAAQQLGQEVKKAAWCWNCRGRIEVKRLQCLSMALCLMFQLNVLHHWQGTWESGGVREGLKRRVIKAVAQYRFWWGRTGQEQKNASPIVLGNQAAGGNVDGQESSLDQGPR